MYYGCRNYPILYVDMALDHGGLHKQETLEEL